MFVFLTCDIIKLMDNSKKYIGIIGAMGQEIKSLISDMENVTSKNICNITYYVGTINNKNIVLAESGVGKVNAAICTTAMILNFNIDKIIHIGIAGSLDKDLKVNDLAIASSTIQYDVDQTFFDMPLGFIQGIDLVNLPCSEKIVTDLKICADNLNINYKAGVIATGDQFISDTNLKNKIITNFAAIACDMESSATNQVCYINKIDFCAVRCFSDGGEDVNASDYFDAKVTASDTATKLIKEYLKTIS